MKLTVVRPVSRRSSTFIICRARVLVHTCSRRLRYTRKLASVLMHISCDAVFRARSERRTCGVIDAGKCLGGFHDHGLHLNAPRKATPGEHLGTRTPEELAGADGPTLDSRLCVSSRSRPLRPAGPRARVPLLATVHLALREIRFVTRTDVLSQRREAETNSDPRTRSRSSFRQLLSRSASHTCGIERTFSRVASKIS